jgi:membrane protease YdiL (CAAX protease family)
MPAAVVVVGALAQVIAWSLVASRRGSVWTVVGPVTVAAGAVAVLTEPPALSGRAPVWFALVAGAAAGAALYAATRAFVAIAVRRWWPAFERDAASMYRAREGRSLAVSVAAAGAVAIGEELFWRGLAQRELGARIDPPVAAALVTLVVYAGVNVSSRNVAIIAGALVGGAVWGALAWATAGVLASVVAHVVWTASMVLLPVARTER